MKGVYIPQRPKRDKLVWGNNRDGEYTVRSGYEEFRARKQREDIYRKIWRSKAIPKAIMFVWASSKNKILTLDNLQKRGWSLPNRCILCKEEEETVDHMLIHCEYAREVWNRVFQAFHIEGALSRNWKEFILAWSSPFRSKRITRLWEIALIQGAWNIWKERNRRTFEGKEKDPRSLWALTQVAIKENFEASTIQGKKEQGIEDEIRRGWNLDQIREEKENPREGIKWTPPPRGWKKLNFDGAAKGNPGEAGGGGVLRDHEGKVLWAYSGYYGTQTNHRAEMAAMSKGIEGCDKRRIDKIIIEGDSLNIIKLISGETKPDWRAENLIEEVRRIIERWEQVKVQHVFREGNQVADRLANWGVSRRQDEEWENDFPMEIQEAALKESVLANH